MSNETLIEFPADIVVKAMGLNEGDFEALIGERRTAREAKDFARSDQIRDELAAQGVVLEDAGGKTTWRRD